MKVSFIRNNSIAEFLGLEVGDDFLSINGFDLSDSVDLAYFNSLDKFKLKYQSGEDIFSIKVNLQGEDFGAELDQPLMDTMQCKNNCIFCFLQQNPPNVRATMNVRDDDYRMSIVDGNFITLTNLSAVQMKKICTYKISPLYVSLHASDPVVHKRMMRYSGHFDIRVALRKLWRAGIKTNIQIVLCPGYNDGVVLEKTMQFLYRKKNVQSVAIVPVGITKYREKLTSLIPVNKSVARDTIHFADFYNILAGRQIFFPADEIYNVADIMIPSEKTYGNYDQYENGIGITRRFIETFDAEIKLKHKFGSSHFCVITGVLAQNNVNAAVLKINDTAGKKIARIMPIINNYFGEKITVTGLVVGSDIIAQYEKLYDDELLIVPDVMLKTGTHQFLDDTTIEDVESSLNIKVIVAETTGDGLVKAMEIKESK